MIQNQLFERIQDNFLYSGLKKEIYLSVKPLIKEENTRIMGSLSMIGCLFGAVMSVLSLTDAVSRRVLPAYLTLWIACSFFSCILYFYQRKQKNCGTLLAYLEMASILSYGIMNSALFAPDPAAIGVTFIVLMVLVPFLLVDVPWRENLFIIAFALFYLIGVYTCKNPMVHEIETTNTISFCLVACMSTYVFTTRTVHNMADRLYIEKERDTDSLTGLSSRHAGEVLIRARLMHDSSGIFVMMDIDNFKNVNDEHGHQSGDHVLEMIGSAVSANIRRKDIACRYGGDEFCILLSDCSLPDAEKIVSRIQAFVASQKDVPFEVTCSFGLAPAHPNEDVKDLVKHADEALYQAKKQGKNTYSMVDSID